MSDDYDVQGNYGYGHDYVHVPNSETVWDGASDRAACDPELERVEVSDSPDGVTCRDCAEAIGLDLDTHRYWTDIANNG